MINTPGRNPFRHLIALACCALLPCLAESQQPGLSDIEIVESVPTGTSLDNPDIRDAGEVWLEMIHGAQHTLDIEQFYVSVKPGETIDTVIGAVVAAARRGVQVRFIVDNRLHRTYPRPVDSLGTFPNISVRVIDYGRIAGGIQHAKFFIVDGQSVYLGSQNFDWRSLTHIHELGLRIRSTPIADAFARIFGIDWALADTAGTPSAVPDGSPAPPRVQVPVLLGPEDTVFLTPTWSPPTHIPDRSLWDETQIVRLIDGARQDLTLQFLTYSPVTRKEGLYRVIDDALRRAAERGVAVKMIVADWEKATTAEPYLRELSAVPNIEVRFSVIPEWSGGYVAFARVEHCKYIVADGRRFWLGSSNCEKNYFYGSRNVGLIGESPALAGQLRQIFRKSWDSPYLEPIGPAGTSTPREHGGE
jgi:phosphatidylserine/phosphatidylglycerophosphate/cardiolipin synthase-like enzyme